LFNVELKSPFVRKVATATLGTFVVLTDSNIMYLKP